MLNKVILIGNLGKDPELRNMPNGQPVTNCSIATTNRYKDSAGNKREDTEWHTLVIYGRLAEIASQYLRKGSKLYVEGHLRTRNWDDKGTKHYRTEVIVDTFKMMGSPKAQDNGGYDDDPTPF